jgi:hypothetical protein
MATTEQQSRATPSFGQKFKATLSMIKIAHTIFAKPFALMGWAFGIAMVNRWTEADPGMAMYGWVEVRDR